MKTTLAFRGDPFAVFKKFYGRKGLFFLDSSRKGRDAQFSYLGFSPFKVIRGEDLNALKKEFSKHRRTARSTQVFTGGAVGYLSYDGKFCFGLYDQVLAFDHRAKTLSIHAPDRTRLNEILAALRDGPVHVPVIGGTSRKTVLKSNFNRSSYMAAVRKVLAHIRNGDIYQINLSRKVEVDMSRELDPMALYSALRTHSPSPFASYFDDGTQVTLSSSPERFLKLSGRTVQVRPMKGTRPRGRSKAEDARLKNELQKSPKEIAELLMVTDLERNDLGRVCDYGSVKVKAMRTIETYQNVFQATATVEGRLHKGKDVFDLLKAAFPSGSVTGCPKIEAMKIIKQLERSSRGGYTGALGYISFTGDMDLSVLIRTLFLTRNKVAFHVGGGIVADSDPAAEYEETCVKAQAMQKALEEVLGG